MGDEMQVARPIDSATSPNQLLVKRPSDAKALSSKSRLQHVVEWQDCWVKDGEVSIGL